MTNPRSFPRRTPLLLATVVVALAVSSAPAYAGGDDCAGSGPPEADDSRLVLGGDDCPPAAPAPVRPAPAPPQPAPAPAPARPAPVPAQPAPVVQQQRTFAQSAQTVPRGGVQAGAGGTALRRTTRPSPLLAIAAVLFGLLSLAGGVRAVHIIARR